MINNAWRVIVSRKSGAGKALADWPHIAELLTRKSIDFSERITDHAYHAIELAEEAVKDGFRRLLVVGGDGALHEVINGIFSQNEVDPSDVTIGLIPVGSGNDWSRMHKIPWDYEKAVDVIAEADRKTCYQDIARVETRMDGERYSRYMINIGGLGFDAEVCRRFDMAKERGHAGDKQYFKSLIKGFLFYKCLKFHIQVDGEEFFRGPAFSVAIGIGKYCGGGMMQTPGAEPDDGLLDITVTEKMGKLKFLTKVRALFKGTVYKLKEVHHTRGHVFEIAAAPYSFMEVDGETIGITPVRISIIPAAIKIVSNREKK